MSEITMEAPPETANESTTSSGILIDPIPMSFPAILRNKTVSTRFAHLQPLPESSSAPAIRRRSRDDKLGKRWIRRKDNDRFKGNPHIVKGEEGDLAYPSPRSTFPSPLPRYLQRSISAPSTPSRPPFDPHSSNAGRFSLSLKGIRRTLRQQRGRAEHVVRDVEDELIDWLRDSECGAIHLPDDPATLAYDPVGRQVRGLYSVFEVSRTPLQLIWDVEQDNFVRYVVHCCARYHNVVSFSKDVEGRRLTYLLRPNVTRPDFQSIATSGIATPPATETDHAFDDSSDHDTTSVADSQDLGSDLDEHDDGQPSRIGRVVLPAVAEHCDDERNESVEHQRKALAKLGLSPRRNLHKVEENAGADADAESDDHVGDEERRMALRR